VNGAEVLDNQDEDEDSFVEFDIMELEMAA
jgi:hypothetical protein